ncbi:unnamed protein product [Auanema sp. JU1783]|nr:unnamed protein product [Auanema sp. JU1783]
MVATKAKTLDQLKEENPDVNGFLIEKWERIFNVFFDRNHSRNVDWGDFYLVVRKVRDIYGAESVQTQFARNSLAALWEGLCKLADADDDQLISIDEWIHLLKKVNPKDEPKWFKDYSNFMFKLFDVSCDGVMDLAEYTDGMNVYGFTSRECDTAFRKFALDGFGDYKGTISPETWTKYFQDLFYSTDRKSIGNNLFGCLE